MKYHLVTLGCAKNTVDSMRLEHALRTGRHTGVDAPEDADLLVVNTCGFIDAAKDESVALGYDEFTGHLGGHGSLCISHVPSRGPPAYLSAHR